MVVCKRCHRRKSRKVYVRHKRDCIPSEKDIQHYSSSKGVSPETLKLRKQKGD